MTDNRYRAMSDRHEVLWGIWDSVEERTLGDRFDRYRPVKALTDKLNGDGKFRKRR